MDWLKARMKERTSMDGMICMGVGASIVILGPLGKLLALALIGYGVWTFWKAE
jgi:hypothetical protein